MDMNKVRELDQIRKSHRGTCTKDPGQSQRGVGWRVGGVGGEKWWQENGDSCT